MQAAIVFAQRQPRRPFRVRRLALDWVWARDCSEGDAMRPLSFALVALCSSVVFSQELPPNRPGFVWVEVHSQPAFAPVRSVVNSVQSFAEAEVRRLANGGVGYYRRTGGHPTGNMPGSRFTGTGYSSSPNNVPTCEPRTRMTLVADAVQRGVDGMYYRVRAWK